MAHARKAGTADLDEEPPTSLAQSPGKALSGKTSGQRNEKARRSGGDWLQESPLGIPPPPPMFAGTRKAENVNKSLI